MFASNLFVRFSVNNVRSTCILKLGGNCKEMANCCDNHKHKVQAAHVHFPDGITGHNLIGVEADGANVVQVHFGFLQTNHKYEIKFDIPNLLLGKNVSPGPNLPKCVDLAVVKVEPTDSSNKNLHVLIHLCHLKEGIMKECFSLEDENKKELAIIINARILGKHTGTPMVKDGIHCLEVIKDLESLSDNEFT